MTYDLFQTCVVMNLASMFEFGLQIKVLEAVRMLHGAKEMNLTIKEHSEKPYKAEQSKRYRTIFVDFCE